MKKNKMAYWMEQLKKVMALAEKRPGLYDVRLHNLMLKVQH